ncbi:RICIN domain-containing protein [Streptomyces sp. NPDC091279]|uniref:RICIN domain-containing protein n=1 Tax=unclassified Streptomyces TaxID=2593676 RepID=UPI003822A489
MRLIRLAAVGTGVALAVGLSGTPASAASATNRFENQAEHLKCLDYRADWGVYVTGCNSGAYQKWTWNNTSGRATALRQVATRACLTVRGGKVAMKPCASADRAALWKVVRSSAGAQIKNNANGTCLGRMANDHVNVARCTGGTSQRWKILP